ncbi:MAG: hypothetical protein ABFC95_08340 [Smithella sp.]
MWEAIKNFFAGLFGGQKNVKKLAGVAAALIAANNREKAAEALVYLRAALVLAKAGKITDELFASAMAKINLSFQDKAIAAALMAFVTIPEIKLGEVNQDVIDILETLIAGIGAA